MKKRTVRWKNTTEKVKCNFFKSAINAANNIQAH